MLKCSETAAHLAIDGGPPVRETMLPYGRQWVSDEDVEAVAAALRSPWLTTGPRVAEFEGALAAVVSASEAVAVCNGTAALHAAAHALGLGPGDEVIVPAMTFAASANCVVFEGAVPVFADVDAGTLLLDPEQVEARITDRTKALVVVDYAGQPCEYGPLRAMADRHGLRLLADSCHALGATYGGRPVGSLADVTAFSLHPAKHITTGEGGVVTTEDAGLARRMRIFRNHGLTPERSEREAHNAWFYEMVDLGFNYRLTDFQAALGLSQLRRLTTWVARRRAIAGTYDEAFARLAGLAPLAVRGDATHAYHLYVVRLDLDALRVDRGVVFAALRAEGIGVNVHYIPVHLHPYYRQRFGTGPGLCPVAEAAYEALLSLPIFPSMTDRDVEDVIEAVRKVLRAYLR